MTDANRQIERLTTLAEQGLDNDLCGTTVEDRWNKMWQLTVEAWAVKGIDIREAPRRKDIERLTKLHDQ